jgi:anti-sigma factor RsiW
VQRLRHLRTHRQVDAIVDDEIAESFRRLVARHLDECPECSHEIAVRRAMKDALAGYGDDPDMIVGLESFAHGLVAAD